MPTMLFNAGDFLRYAGHKKFSGVRIQIKSEIMPDAARQNAGLSGVTTGSFIFQIYNIINYFRKCIKIHYNGS